MSDLLTHAQALWPTGPTKTLLNTKPNNPIRLTLDLGPVPSFKNGKLLSRGRLITDPKKQKWMRRAVSNIMSQLVSLAMTTGDETSTVRQRLSLIVSSLPADDSCKFISKITIQHYKGPRAGAVIMIEPLNQQEAA